MKVYGFLYNGMTEESGYSTISLHKTKEGAEKAMNEHRENEIREFEVYKERLIESFKEDNTPEEIEILTKSLGTYDTFKDWLIDELEVLD